MPAFTDQTGREIYLSQSPSKIVSLVPSQTELLYDLGLEQEVIGISKFCIHPVQWFTSKTKVGGTKTLNLSRIEQLSPDLIIANKEENTKEQIESLSAKYPVWISDIRNTDDACEMIIQLGSLTGRKQKAENLAWEIQAKFKSIPIPRHHLKAVYLIWQGPFMTAGSDTFIHCMLEAAGFENAFKSSFRYPVITLQEIKAVKPEIILLSSEPFPFVEKHVKAMKEILPETRIKLVDGELFSWYGSRLLQSPGYFQELAGELLS